MQLIPNSSAVFCNRKIGAKNLKILVSFSKALKEHSTKNISRCKQEIVLTLGYLQSLKRQFFLGKEELLIEVCKIPY